MGSISHDADSITDQSDHKTKGRQDDKANASHPEAYITKTEGNGIKTDKVHKGHTKEYCSCTTGSREDYNEQENVCDSKLTQLTRSMLAERQNSGDEYNQCASIKMDSIEGDTLRENEDDLPNINDAFVTQGTDSFESRQNIGQCNDCESLGTDAENKLFNTRASNDTLKMEMTKTQEASLNGSIQEPCSTYVDNSKPGDNMDYKHALSNNLASARPLDFHQGSNESESNEIEECHMQCMICEESCNDTSKLNGYNNEGKIGEPIADSDFTCNVQESNEDLHAVTDLVCPHVICRQCKEDYILRDPDDPNGCTFKCPFCVH